MFRTFALSLSSKPTFLVFICLLLLLPMKKMMDKNNVQNADEEEVNPLEHLREQIDANENNTNKTCDPKIDVVFHKTHKCSSTTIQNILMRYAQNNDLNLVLPKDKNRLGPIQGFTHNSIKNTMWFKAQLRPNIFCLHNRWNGKEVAKLYSPRKAYYFTILRDPLSLFISSWDYWDIGKKMNGISLQDFAMSSKKPEKLMLAGGVNYKHVMLWDFGIDIKDHNDEVIVAEKIKEIDETFDLVLLVEHFRESMVLLKYELCWNFEDLASLRLNSHDDSKRSEIDEDARENLRNWLKTSYIFYNYFKAKFLTRVRDFGRQEMTEELELLDDANRDAEEKCRVKFVPKSTLKKADRPYGNGVLGYKVMGAADHPECIWMAIQEPKYIDVLRRALNKKALAKISQQINL